MVKEAGLQTVPSHGHPGLVDLLERFLDRSGHFGRERLRVVHRLDRDTSGVLVFGRTREATAELARQFAGQGTEREYVAVLAGALAEDVGVVRARLDGKPAATHWQVLARRLDTTAVAVRLETGRRNQIRRHFADLGHPVVGDTHYAPEAARHPAWPQARLALHARSLGFAHPRHRRRCRYEAPLPEAFAAFV